jgi:PAS domain S-box-containing protein/putative nucleotidyltransferase with HDIG domain
MIFIVSAELFIFMKNNTPDSNRDFNNDLQMLNHNNMHCVQQEDELSDTKRSAFIPDYEILFNNIQIPVIIVLLDPDLFNGRIIDINEEAIKLTGYSRSEFVDMKIINLVQSDNQLTTNMELLSNSNNMSTQLSIIKKNGDSIPVDINIQKTEIAKYPVAIFTLQNTTKLKQYENSLKENESIYRSLFEDSSDAITITTRDGQIIDANTAACDLFGYTSEEFKKINVSQLFYDANHRLKFLSLVQEKSYLKDYRIKYVKKDGSNIECMVTTTCWHNAERDIFGYRNIIRDLTEYASLTKKLEQSNAMLSKALEGAIQALSTMSEVRDPYTAGHQKRVAQLAARIAVELGFPSTKVRAIHFAALMHDIGKISIPAELLSKPNALAEIEKVFIQNHPLIGYEILKNIEFPWPICEMVIQHHERLDGSGYPKHLRGEEISIEARILAVADVVEAMSSHRPYRPSLGITRALEEIATNSGTLYDSRVVKACLKIFREDGFNFSI